MEWNGMEWKGREGRKGCRTKGDVGRRKWTVSEK